MLQRQGTSQRVPKSPFMAEDEPSREKFENKTNGRNVALRVGCNSFVVNCLFHVWLKSDSLKAITTENTQTQGSWMPDYIRM